MRVMVIVKASKESEAGEMPSENILADMGKYSEQLVQAGVMLAGEGLRASSNGKRMRFSGKDRTIVDGPFAESKELIAGFWLWQVRTMAEAIEWLRRAPFDGGAEIELRPVIEVEDLGKELRPEVQAREEQLRAEVVRQRKA